MRFDAPLLVGLVFAGACAAPKPALAPAADPPSQPEEAVVADLEPAPASSPGAGSGSADDGDDEDDEIDAEKLWTRLRRDVGHCSPETIAKLDRWIGPVEYAEGVDRYEETRSPAGPELRVEAWSAGNGIGAETATLYLKLNPVRCEGVAAIVEHTNDTPFLAWVTAESLTEPRPDEPKILQEAMGLSVSRFAPETEPAHLFHEARGLPTTDLADADAGDRFGGEDVSEADAEKRAPDVGNVYVEKGRSTTRWIDGSLPDAIPSVIRIVAPGRGWLSRGVEVPTSAIKTAGDYDVITIESFSRWGTATLLVLRRSTQAYRFVGTRGGLFGLPRWEHTRGEMIVGVLETKGHPRVPNQNPVVLDLARGRIYALSTDPDGFFIDGVEPFMPCEPAPALASGKWVLDSEGAEDSEGPCRHHVFEKNRITQIDCAWAPDESSRRECVATKIRLNPLLKWIRRH